MTLATKVKWYFLPICFCIFYPLVLVRKIEAFAKFHIFGDAMIIITLIVMCVFAGIQDEKDGWENSPELTWFNKKLWPDAIGFAVYSFEGVGVVLPIYEITADKKNYFKVICYVCIFITALYIAFSEYCLFTYFN